MEKVIILLLCLCSVTYLFLFRFQFYFNFYIYNGEPEVPWFFWAVGCCQYKYIDLDGVNEISNLLSGYVLSKPNFFYKTENENTAAVVGHINNNRISSIEKFLERLLSEQTS